MTRADDPRLADAHAMPIEEVVNRLGIARLTRAGHELVGPCPQCGGRDRFGVNLRKNIFLCRRCDAKGDQVALVMFDRGLDFRGALDWLCGPATELSEAERRARAARAEKAEAERQRVEARERAKAIAAARAIWQEGKRPEGTDVEAYLDRRGIRAAFPARLPASLRFHPDLAYTVRDGTAWRTVHRGPAMLAAIQGPDHRFSGVHRTWLDLSTAKGKARITDPATGEVLQSKKVLGSKKGGAIRLTPGFHATLVMAEGIETTASAAIGWTGEPALFWAGVDLGNMGGRRETGRGLKFAGRPDMADDAAFLPPAGITRLVYVMDGDSDPRHTESVCLAGLRRAMLARPGLVAQLARAPRGLDLNDVLLGAVAPAADEESTTCT